MTSLSALLRSFEFESLGEGRYTGVNAPEGPGVVFGGQLIAQSILLAGRDHPGKLAVTAHTVFSRGVAFEPALEIEVDVMHTGRTFGSSLVTVSQEGKLRTRSMVLFGTDEVDTIRHEAPVPDRPEPDAGDPDLGSGDWEVAIPGVDISDPAFVGPPELDVWARFAGAPDEDPLLAQALLAYTTDPFLVATAMLPHEGVAQSLAHTTFSTGVISHTLTFHERVHADRWMLLSHDSPYAGHGRSYGRGAVFQGGHLVASFVQDAMIRAMPEGHKGL